MAINKIRGTVESWGASTMNSEDQSTTYDHIRIITDTGEPINISNVTVKDSLARLIQLGNKGLFIVSGYSGFNHIIAIRVGSDEAQLNVQKEYGASSLTTPLIIAGFFSVFIIGIPFFLYLLWATSTASGRVKKLNFELDKEGFNLRNERSI